MPQIMTGGLPEDLDLGGSFTLQVAALDPATGAAVAGVNITTFVIEAKGLKQGVPVPDLEPVFIPVPPQTDAGAVEAGVAAIEGFL